MIKIGITGVLSETGREAAEAVLNAGDLKLVMAVGISNDDSDIKTATILKEYGISIKTDISKTIDEAEPDVIIDCTMSSDVYEHICLYMKKKVKSVVSTAGLNDEQTENIKIMSGENNTSCLIIPDAGSVMPAEYAGRAVEYARSSGLTSGQNNDLPEGACLEAGNTGASGIHIHSAGMTGHRYSNFELMRIIAMCFVVTSHYAQHGLIKVIQSRCGIGQFLTMFLHSLGAIGVVLFVLLTGYFMIDKKTNVKHIFKIVIETVFYSYGILIIFALFFKDMLAPLKVYRSLLPVLAGQYWFVTAYFVLYLAIPLLNKLINDLDKKTLSRFLVLFIFLWFVIPLFGYKIKLASSAFTIFITLYSIGAYIKKYGLPFFEKKRNAVLVILVSESIICIYQIIFVITHFLKYDFYMHIAWSKSILTILTAVSIFMLIKNIKINYNPAVNFFSSSAFAVYLITENIFVRDIIWTKVFHCNHFLKSPPLQDLAYIVLNLAFALVISYIACTLIDKIRARLTERILMDSAGKIYGRIYKFITKFI